MKKTFKKGEYVVALTTNPEEESYQTRVEDKVYKVVDTLKCESCKMESINIGVVTKYKNLECSCGHIQDSKGLKWTSSEHFSYIQKEHIPNALRFALDEEDYEIAVELRDMKL